MRIKRFIIPVFIIGCILSLISFPYLTSRERVQEQKSQLVIIPNKVKNALQEGKQSRQPRLDIPFTIVKMIYLPSGGNIHNVFLFKVKNADLGFSAATQAGKTPEKKKEVESSFESTPAQIQARSHIFLQFNQLDGDIIREVYVPVNLQVDGAFYEPDKEEIYTVCYPLPPGRYLLSMAVASQKLEKIGIQHIEFSNPNPGSFTEGLETTPVFFAKKIERMSVPETGTEIHQKCFTYSILQIEPNLDQQFSAGENLDVFFFIFGAQFNDANRCDIEVSFEVLKGEQKVILYAPTKYDSPLVSQPLPMKITKIVKTTDESGKTTEKTEASDLEAGDYTLNIDIKDNLSGKAVKKSINFVVE